MENWNSLTIEAYNGTTRITGPTEEELQRAGGLQYETLYPGGLFGSGRFTVPRPILRDWALGGANRIIIRHHSGDIAYEGYIAGQISEVNSGSQGITVPLIGAWERIMMRRRLRKPWADTRISDDVWVYNTTSATAAEKCFLDRNNRIRFTPKGEAWTNNQRAYVEYTAPTGQTVKRITFTYTLAEATQAWAVGLYNSGTSAFVWTATSSGSAAVDHTLATPSQSVQLSFLAQANQTPTSDGTYYGQFSGITVYTETGAIDMVEIAKDVRAALSELNTDETQIDTGLTVSLVPFVMADWDTTCADILMKAAGYGDSSYNRIAVQLLQSELADTPNGEPVLYVDTYPVLTDYDYGVRLDDVNVQAPLAIEKDYQGVKNWIAVGYRDARGFEQWTTPDDDANLKDTTSITDYGQHDWALYIGDSTSALAIQYGRRFLAAWKDPRWVVNGPVTVKGYIVKKTGERVPASLIRAGQRLKILDFADDVVDIITHTAYNDATQTCAMSLGKVDPFFYPARPQPPVVKPGREKPTPRPSQTTPAASEGGGSYPGGNGSGGGDSSALDFWEDVGDWWSNVGGKG